MPPKKPDQQAWTLRFKKHKTTIVILVRATQSLQSIKQDLLSSIKASGKVDINGVTIPSDESDITLGVPVERHNPSHGWVELEIEPDEGAEKKKKTTTSLNDSPMAAGLRDGDVLAFRFEGEEDWDVIMPSYDDEQAAKSEQ